MQKRIELNTQEISMLTAAVQLRSEACYENDEAERGAEWFALLSKLSSVWYSGGSIRIQPQKAARS